ncbi:MAG: hypothetical protein RIC56_07945 [Pseudomonadales bacterium]
MNVINYRLRLLAAAACVGLVAGCGGGDIKISPTTVDNSVDNSTSGGGGGTTSPCASYTTSGGQTVTGSFSETTGNCTYTPSFADAGNNIEVDLRIPALPNNGAHIFQGSLFIGVPCDSDACLANNGITEGGDGPTLTVEAGATLAWQTNSNFLIINRGSQLFAVGTETAPITFTSLSDVDGTVGPEDVQQWGGIVINGFGITNECEYNPPVSGGGAPLDERAGLTLAGECHVRAEGAAGLDESFYGGDNDNDSSGRLEYVVVKHTGATVGSGDELNGITFGGVGRNTIVRNLQMYSTFDDGIEMFGGAVNFENYVAVYVRDDSIDIDEGWIGSITNALVIQSESIGNHCIEADGIGGFDGTVDYTDLIARGLNSRSEISNLTCIISPSVTQGDFDPGAGWRLREGMFATIRDSQVITSFAPDGADANYCLRLDNRSAQGALDGDIVLDNNVFACAEPDNGSDIGNGQTASVWAAANGDNFFATVVDQADPTAAADADLVLLDGIPPIYSVADNTILVDGATPDFTATPPGTANGYIGGISLIDIDWIQNWTYGILDGSRAQPLWFE